MQIALLTELAILPALRFLGDAYADPKPVRLMRSIAIHESGLTKRAQIGGPARGWWQFERSGVAGVLSHHGSRDQARHLCDLLGYVPDVHIVHTAVEHNDILAAGFARLALWVDPMPIPDDADAAYLYYLRTWRPGIHRPHDWPKSWAKGALA